MNSRKVHIREVGPRDGLQNLAEEISTEAKIRMVNDLAASGLKYIEASAFVSAKAVPQLKDAKAVFQGIQKAPDVAYAALVPNKKGYEAAVEAGAKEVAVFTAASETFNQKNIRASIEKSFERFEPVLNKASSDRIPVRAYVSTAFFCPYEGEISVKDVVPIVDRLLEMGCYEVSIGDTIGRATPAQVEALLEVLLKTFSESVLAGHYHDTYGQALANILKSFQMGLSRFDSSLGGLGGCPYAPGASGNVATEEVLFMFEGMGVDTGVDLELLQLSAQHVEEALRRDLPSGFFKAYSSERN